MNVEFLADTKNHRNFDSAVIETVIHELSHSYINPVLKQSAGDFEQAGEALYLSQRPKMERQAYRNGYTVVNETLTRACTNRFLQARRSPTEVEGDYAYNRSRGFVWIPEVGDWLEEYEQGRDRFPTFADFMPVLAERLAELTEDLPRSQDELEARRPRVVEVSPTPGSQSVDPELEVIVVTFDRPMRAGSWSVVGGGPRYPETGEPSFDENRRIFSLPVRLEPEHDYELWLNRGPYTSFLSDEGVPLAPFQITFRTARR